MSRTRLLPLCLIALGFAAPLRAENAVVPDAYDQAPAVNVCETYGTGFTQVPGTSSCVRVGGELRYEKSIGANRPAKGSSLEFEFRSN
ncbi:porin [Rhizobium alvei]|uniref:Porin n=1 Tax=Rhizobium alvei TaxID=1132659 RepID=A0ABT8YGM2_9HYPH|nr:porin [Rhizobium alvei]MDO6962483.1 porin [Rhizobium alvei]